MRITFDEVESQRDGWRVALTVTGDDGGVVRYLHGFPHDSMEWRAAEYGIDPADTATLLDLILIEPHLNDDERGTGHALYSAPDIATARADHLARCARAKLRLRVSTRAKGTPLQRVRDESPMDHEVLAVKREHVQQVREQQQVRRVPVAPLSGTERAARLRRQLSPPAIAHDPKGDL